MIPPSRRAFLRTLLSLPIAATVDVERLLWTPSPLIVVPRLVRSVTIDEINRVTMAAIFPGVVDQFFTATPILEYVRACELRERR